MLFAMNIGHLAQERACELCLSLPASSRLWLFAFVRPCPNLSNAMAAVVMEVDRTFVKALVERGCHVILVSTGDSL